MSSFILKRTSSSIHSQNPNLKLYLLHSLFSLPQIQCQQLSTLHSKHIIRRSGYDSFWKISTGLPSFLLESFKISSGSFRINIIPFPRNVRLFGSQAAAQPSTADGLTVEGIIASEWTILEESESDWKSHASSIAQSIHLIKKRLKWKKLEVRLGLLSAQLNKPDLWDDPVHAGKINREHGSLINKVKVVEVYEQELLEHIDMIKLARQENDSELELESVNALLSMRRTAKEKELEALLAGEHDSCSCFIEVHAGAGGTESMDWAAMVMQMYKMWAEHRGYRVTLVDEMPGEMAGIKVHSLTICCAFKVK